MVNTSLHLRHAVLATGCETLTDRPLVDGVQFMAPVQGAFEQPPSLRNPTCREMDHSCSVKTGAIWVSLYHSLGGIECLVEAIQVKQRPAQRLVALGRRALRQVGARKLQRFRLATRLLGQEGRQVVP